MSNPCIFSLSTSSFLVINNFICKCICTGYILFLTYCTLPTYAFVILITFIFLNFNIIFPPRMIARCFSVSNLSLLSSRNMFKLVVNKNCFEISTVTIVRSGTAYHLLPTPLTPNQYVAGVVISPLTTTPHHPHHITPL